MIDLPIIQRAHDLIHWYVPILNRLPRDHKYLLGDRIISGLYDLLEGLIRARYSSDKLPQLQALNSQLDVLRHQTRLLLEFGLLSPKRFGHAGAMFESLGRELGGWIRQQQNLATS